MVSNGDTSDLPARLGPYRLDRGSASIGSTGVVVRAEHVGSGHTVALKLANELAPGPRTRLRLAREARIAHDVDSRFVVEVLEEQTEDERPYLVMEWIPQTVASAVNERQIDERTALRIMLEAAEALSAIHQRGIVHRDISPRNIGLTHDLEVRVLDFGIAASAAESGSASTAALGTPAFSAPERLSETRYDDDPRIDLYSLGGVGYLLLTGVAPFEGTRSEVIRRHRNEDWPDLEAAPERLRPMLGRLLAPDPSDRYQTAAELVEALRALLGMPSNAPPRAAAPRSRSGTWASLIPVFGVGIAAVIAVLVRARDQVGDTPTAGPPPVVATATSTPTPAPPPPGPIAGWGEVPVDAPVDGPVTLVSTETHVYAMQNGGELTDDSITIWSATILGNGMVGPWFEQQRIQTGRGGFPTTYRPTAMALSGECLFVLPGDTNAEPISEEQVIEVARVDPATGDLGPFRLAESLNERRAGAALIAAGGRLYAIGGFQVTGSEDRRSVEFANVDANCDLSSWVMTESLASADAAPRAVSNGSQIWVVGGHPGDSGAVPVADVQRTTINGDGSLEPWESLLDERLLTPRFPHSLAIVDEHLVVVGGNIQAVGTNPTIYTETVEYAEIQADGTLGLWKLAPALPEPRATHGMTSVRGELLVVGGGVGRRTPQIEIARTGLTTNLAIGTPPEPPGVAIDDELPAIVSLDCAPTEARTGEPITCDAETSGTARSMEWATSTTTSEGPSVTFTLWAPQTQLLTFEACNSLGCSYGDIAVFVTADPQFWETDQIVHPDSLPASGGEFKPNTVAGTQDLEFGADVVFRIVGPEFDQTLVGELCAAARHSWGISICYDALFEIPPNTSGEAQTYTIEASAPTIEGVLTSSFTVATE